MSGNVSVRQTLFSVLCPPPSVFRLPSSVFSPRLIKCLDAHQYPISTTILGAPWSLSPFAPIDGFSTYHG